MSTNEAALPQSTVRVAQADPDGILLVIHAGAGNRGKKDTPERRAQVEQDLNRALEAGYALLEQGAPAEDAVCAAIRVMEDAPEFNAGRGAALTSEGIVSMDSCLMTGVDGEVGSACGLTTSKNPINVARAIKEKTKATPLYTNYAAGWTMGAWDAYIGGTASGDPNYMNNVFTHTKNPFKDPGDGTHAYNVYKILYDAVADGLTEDDYSTTDWETSKNKLNSGDIATMVLGSWAVSQIQSAGDNAKDVGYMPFPISVKGKQYATSASDYAYGINKNSSTTNQEAAMIFVKWLTEKSNYAYNEGGVSIAADDDKLPDLYSDFKNVKLIADEPAPDGEEDLFNDLNSDSELNINTGGDSRVQSIVEHAANKDESYNDLVKEWNQKWNDALDSEGVDTK